MLDDVKLSCTIPSWEEFKNVNKGRIRRPYWKVFEDDGDVKTEEDDGSPDQINEAKIKWRVDKSGGYKYSTIIHYTGFQTYTIEVRETTKVFIESNEKTKSYFLTIQGSIRSNHFNGTNAGRLTFQHLQSQIALLEQLHLNSVELKIDNLAPSLCFEFPFPVLDFLDDCLILYRGNRFKQYDPDSSGKIIGYYCPLRQVDIKIYDKSLQLNLPGYLLQFEDSFSKMQRLKNDFGIEFLADLKDYHKVERLKEVLLRTWDDILLYDNTVSPDDHRLNERQREMVKNGDSFRYWEKLKKSLTSSTYNNRINEFKQLSKSLGSNYYELIRDMINKEWSYLMQTWTNLPGVKYNVSENQLDKITSSVGGKYIQLYKRDKDKAKQMVVRLKNAS